MTASLVPWDTPGGALKRSAGVAVAVCLLAWLTLLPAHVSAAQNRSPSPSPEGLWKAYPLAPTAEPAPKQASSPATSARTNRRPAGAATGSDGGVPVFVLVLLVLVTAGGMLTVVRIKGRRRRETEPAAVPAPLPASSAAAGDAVPALWHGPSGRFNRAASEPTA